MTQSIVARNDRTGEFGVAVASHAFAVGRAVPFALPGVGAVATQGVPSPGHAEHLLNALAKGHTAVEALTGLLAEDRGSLFRQTALVAASGPAAAHTGEGCVSFAGHVTRDAMSCQGNLLTADGTWERMADAYHSARVAWEDRLLAALEAGLAAGGDLRGQQSAALLVVGPRPGSRPRIDLRVDDHPAPVDELRRLMALGRADHKLREALSVITGAPGDSRDTLQLLDEAQRVFGAANQEPNFWAGFILESLGEGTDRYPVQAPWQELRRRLKGLVTPHERTADQEQEQR